MLFNFNPSEQAFNPARDIPDLSGKAILVTGGNTGLGAATIKLIAPHNPSVIYLCARPVSILQAEELVSFIKISSPNINIKILPLDLSSLENIKEFASDFLKEARHLDLLFLNAGISSTAPALTEDGYESQFGINHIGHALLTQLLMPKLLETQIQGRQVRILVTSSLAAYFDPPPTGLVLDEMKKADPLASPYQRYAHSKIAAILFARKLSQVYPSILSVSFNPGQVKTDLFKKATGINPWISMLVATPIMWLTGVSPEKGAENGLWAAFADDVKNGAAYEPVGVLEESKKFFTDQKLADELWEWTNKELAAHGSPGWPEA
ncbi:NAD(P)-binding protein [Fusarium austroafricanum]|uniref:NAD(P)-binding protein n=1 Tax=Fusarium austroafricanum TaxID=2364996 RepID=A0A8H4KMG5_9HYPO|nr:NAD(P)-binding protein [Fusarium austroafricanum]